MQVDTMVIFQGGKAQTRFAGGGGERPRRGGEMYTRLVSAIAIAVGTAHAVHAAEIELTLSHWVPGTHPLQVTGMEPWAESIKEASNGRIQINIFPASQLGAAGDHYDMARDGIVDIGFINPGYQPGRFPILAAAEIPFLFADARGGLR